tara:strand:+ start:1543 stop:1761 length:219 start_codon:yes stop_codon:yes gene_type:complete
MSKYHPKRLGPRGLIAFYKQLLKEGRIKKHGSSHKRLVELETKFNNRTGQAVYYKKQDQIETDFDWLKKVMN